MTDIVRAETELPEERRRAILETLTRKGKASTNALAALHQVSVDAIRRDLRDMARAGLLQRVHGGALPLSPSLGACSAREKKQSPLRLAVARAAAGLFENGMTAFFDSGATSLDAAASLRPDAAGVAVTASPAIAVRLAGRPNLEILLLGGRLDQMTMTCLGAAVVEEVRRMRFDLCLLGVCGLRPDSGATCADFEEARQKAAIVARSGDVAALATADKLGAAATHLIAPLDSLTHLVTEAGLSEEVLAPYRRAGLEIVQGVTG